MRRRTKGREYALQILYQIEVGREVLEQSLLEFWENLPDSSGIDPDLPEIRAFAEDLVRRVLEHSKEIDAEIEKCAEHWRINRMALVDRNILRLGTCEILHFDDIPSKVAINEAIELAKRYGDSDSPKFVNGILDRVAKSHKVL